MAKTKETVLPDQWVRSDRDDGTFYASRWHEAGQLEASGATLDELVANAVEADKNADKSVAR